MRTSLFLGGVIALLAFVPLSALAASPAASTNLTIVGGNYTNDTTPTFTWTAAPGAVDYGYRMNNDTYHGLGNVTSYTAPSMRDGWHTFQIVTKDANGNLSTPAAVTFEIDTEGPTLSTVTPTTATVASPVTLKTTATGEAWTSSCRFSVDGADVGVMNESKQTFSKTVTFSTSGKHKVFATCVDGDGNTTIGNPTTITVDASWQAGEDSLIKSESGSTIYYYGTDGMRHAFPNESVFFTWYDNFTDVTTVSDVFLNSLPLGSNVTVHPGNVMLRFATSNDVYAVDHGNQLRRYVDLSLALLDYGGNWTALFITLPDVLRSNYTTGANINDAHDYDPEDAWDSLKSIADLYTI